MRRLSRWALAAAVASVALPTLAATAAERPLGKVVGRSVLPAETFTDGPVCGQNLGAAMINGCQAPFGQHPVQGFSAVLDAGDGSFWLAGDNGFGYIENSADHLLRVYRVKPSFRAARGQGPGGMTVLGHFTLRDPDRHLPYAITNQFTQDRLLTGTDLDIESFQRAADGSFWFGDEFGPFLVHTDASGKLLEPPVPLPDFDQPGREIRSPQNPMSEETAALRFMNALRAHARAHGAKRMPVFSPYHLMLDDGDAGTVSPRRPLPGSPSSELHSVKQLQAAGHAVVPWTVNDPQAMRALLKLGVRGLISDSPDLLRREVEAFDADGDGRPGDYLDADGLIDLNRFDAQGHRGARNLRPESTFPAFEAALDHLISTLETDCGVTKDGVPVLNHEPELMPAFARRPDGGPVRSVIHHLTLREVQARYVLDRLQPDRPGQSRDLADSPVAVAFAREAGLAHPYMMPSLDQLFQFVRFYERYYRTGPGQAHADAVRRWKNAGRVHFDVETKTSPESEKNGATPKFDAFARAVADAVRAAGMEERTQIQSFDYRTLLTVQAHYPALQTVFLLGVEAPFGTRLAGQPAPAAPKAENAWIWDVVWPFEKTARENPFRSQKTGGFEAMAISPDGTKLYPMLEKPLTGGEPNTLPIYEFDLATKRYTGVRARYRTEPGSTSVPDFILTGPRDGLLIERDDREGDLTAFKKIYRVSFGEPGEVVKKSVVLDLLRLADPDGYSGVGQRGDVGLGKTFALPFFTIEGLVKLGPKRLGIVTDNNFPFSVGRHRGTMRPDDSEFVIIETEGL